MELDLDDYKLFLKPNVRDAPKHIFPFRHILDKYSPLMKLIMRYFTCEGRFSRLYRYHVRLLMHFTSTKTLNLSNFLFRSLVKMTEKIQTMGKAHITNLFHHSLIKILVVHQLSAKKVTWKTFLEKLKTAPMEVGSSRKHVEFSKVARPEVTKTYQIILLSVTLERALSGLVGLDTKPKD